MTAATGPLRILLVDDQKLIRSGFAMMLSVESDLEVIGEASDGAEAITAARELDPDVILMDVQMPVMDGIAATEQIVTEGLAKVVILTTFDRDDYLFDALRAGASGFLLKNAEADQFVEAVRAVGHGHALLAPEVTRRVIEQITAPADGGVPEETAAGSQPVEPPALAHLTDREREILTHLGRGRSNGEIAAELFIGEATVKTHVSNVLAKLQLRDRIQAVIFAYEAGLVRAGD